ncbi:MAG: transcriptional repressor LexA [candidate division WOR-3 bacterium]
MDILSEKEEEVLNFINIYNKKNGYPPTVREICTGLNKKSTKGIFVHLLNLERKGYIERLKGLSRGIKIKKHFKMETISVLGNISAGRPLISEENIEDGFLFPDNVEGKFFLKVKGDSMEGAMIYDGDMVLVEKSEDVKNKDIIVAFLNGEFTLKRFIVEKGKIYLKAENPKYPLIEIKNGDDFQPFGKVVGVLKKL